MICGRRAPALRALTGAVVFGMLYLFLHQGHFVGDGEEPAAFPIEYSKPSNQSTYCQNHFGTLFLENLSKHPVEYCTPESKTRLLCFSSASMPDQSRVDVMCVGGPTRFDSRKGKFMLDCRPRELSDEEIEMGAQTFEQFPDYWYHTGPNIIMANYTDLKETDLQATASTEPKQSYVLIKREAAHGNIWHSLMEIMAAQMSLDVLHMTTNLVVDRPHPYVYDISKTQVVILDDLSDDHFFDLWTLFAKKPPIRLSQMVDSADVTYKGNIIIPLAGAANQFWQGDWELLGCTDSSLLKGFSKRVLDFYHVPEVAKSSTTPIVLTFVDRKTTRKLVDQDQSLALLRQMYPQIQVDALDFSSMSFADQLAITRKTDILVGAHGAGLTHGMFLRPGSVLVEILPVNFHHKGFHNMASMLGHGYFMQESENNTAKTGATGDWQADNVFLQPADFVALVRQAVESITRKAQG